MLQLDFCQPFSSFFAPFEGLSLCCEWKSWVSFRAQQWDSGVWLFLHTQICPWVHIWVKWNLTSIPEGSTQPIWDICPGLAPKSFLTLNPSHCRHKVGLWASGCHLKLHLWAHQSHPSWLWVRRGPHASIACWACVAQTDYITRTQAKTRKKCHWIGYNEMPFSSKLIFLNMTI